jgi:hypothetical protein
MFKVIKEGNMKDKLLLLALLGLLVLNIQAQSTDIQIIESILKKNTLKWNIDERVTMRGNRVVGLNLNGDITANSLTILSHDIGKLTELEVLTLNDNDLLVIPEEIYSLAKLKKLEIKSNSLQILPEGISKLVSLEELDLRHNGLTQLPADITGLKSIKKLQLWGNRLTTLPHNIGDLYSLKELYLTNNRLRSLPKSITKLDLSYLDISFNYLRDNESGIDTWLKKFNKKYKSEQFAKKDGAHFL